MPRSIDRIAFGPSPLMQHLEEPAKALDSLAQVFLAERPLGALF
jgi:hypothetical protein